MRCFARPDSAPWEHPYVITYNQHSTQRQRRNFMTDWWYAAIGSLLPK